MNCPCCGAAGLIHETRDISIPYKDGSIVVPAVTGDFCSACGESILDREQSERCMTAMRVLREASASEKRPQ